MKRGSGRGFGGGPEKHHRLLARGESERCGHRPRAGEDEELGLLQSFCWELGALEGPLLPAFHPGQVSVPVVGEQDPCLSVPALCCVGLAWLGSWEPVAG